MIATEKKAIVAARLKAKAALINGLLVPLE